MTINMNNLAISLLGSFQAALDEKPITQFRTKSVQALLIFLACEAERPYQREQLMELLWPGMPQTSAQANMRQTLYRLRKLIPEVQGKDGETAVPFLLTNRQTIQINPDADYFLDVAAFAKSDPAQASALYRGDFLADFYLPDSEAFEEWASARRADYRRRVLEIMEGETAVHLQQARYDQAIQLAQRQIEIDNLRESSHRQLIEAWAKNGHRREALSIPGEMVFQVPTLAIPTGKQRVTVENWQEYEALHLFVDRATAVLPHFQVTPDNITPLVQICQQLDGIPLALELAAARMKVLTTQQIATRLDDRFRLLTGGSRTALPRQQTLQALIDWSWELLSPDEQQLFQRLSVFAGGMNLEAVEAVCAGDGLDVYDILDLLSELVNKSLIVARREQGQETRYRLLETVRRYTQEKLDQANQEATFRQRHLAYFVGLGQQAEPALVGPDQAAWIRRLEKEFDNIRAALGWALEVDADSGLRLASYLHEFWEIGYLSEGTLWLAQLLTGAESIAPETRAKALWVRGMLGVTILQADTVHQLAEESLALYRHLEDQKGIANNLLLLGFVVSWHQGFDKGYPYFQESLAIFNAIEDPFGMAQVLSRWGLSESALLNNNVHALAHGMEIIKESEQLFREVGHLAGIANSLSMAALIATWQGNYPLARPMLEESLSFQEQSGRKDSPATFSIFGRLHFWLGEYDLARAYLEQSLALSQQCGDNAGELWALVNLGHIVLRQNEHSKARAILAKSLQMFQDTGVAIGPMVVYAIEGLASLAVPLEEPERATRLFAWADAAREAWQNVRPINEQKDVDRDMVTIREMIDQKTFDAAYAAGQAMTAVEAMAYALDG